MKRSTWEGQTLVYRYGCPSWAQLGDDAMGQLRAAHNLWNELVAIDRRHGEVLEAIRLLDQGVEEATVELAGAEEWLEAVLAQAKRERQRGRSTKPREATRVALAAAKAEVRQARKRRKVALAESRLTRRPLERLAEQARRGAVQATYEPFCQSGPFLSWATFNDVKDSFEAARKRVLAARSQGKPAQLRFRRWDGTGTLAMQVMHYGDTPRSPEELSNPEGRYSGVTVLPWARPDEWASMSRSEQRHAGRQSFHMSLTRGRSVGVPVVMHRPVPSGADVTYVRLTRRKVGSHYRLSVAVTFRLPAVEEKRSGASTAVYSRWASAGDGTVTVARVASSRPLPPVPRDLEGFVALRGVSEADVYFPAGLRRLLGRDDGIRSRRDDLLDALRVDVCKALADPALADHVEATAAEVARWRAPSRFVRLARRWPVDHPLVEVLEAWRQRDRHLWDFEGHERDQVVARRRDAWRKVAAWLCESSQVLVLHDLDMATVRKSAEVGAEDTFEARAGRRQMQLAAPGELRHAVKVAAGQRGVQVLMVGSNREEAA